MQETCDWVYTIICDYPSELLPLHRVNSLQILAALADRTPVLYDGPSQLGFCFIVFECTREEVENSGLALAQQALRAANLPGITTYETTIMTLEEVQQELERLSRSDPDYIN